MIKNTEISMHLAAQYLAAAAISFVEKKADDSHTNLRFDVDGKFLETHPLSSQGDTLSLNYKSFSLEWLSSAGTTSLSLEGKTHSEILEWLDETSHRILNKEYIYEFHYDLDYALDDNHRFQFPDMSRINELTSLRILTEHSLAQIIKDNHLHTSVRIWPHHFDTGGFSALKEDSNISIGFGLAIPDTVCEEHYFYLSGYQNGKALETSAFNDLSYGKWLTNDFKGAILAAKNANESEVLSFFQEGIDRIKEFHL